MLKEKNNDGFTPINIASLNGHLETVKNLYETCHANVETKDKHKHTPIFNAFRFGHSEVVKYLCEACHAKI